MQSGFHEGSPAVILSDLPKHEFDAAIAKLRSGGGSWRKEKARTITRVEFIDKIDFMLSKFVGLEGKQIMDEVVKGLEPVVRAELAASYANSGVHTSSERDKHINLYAACVTNSIIEATVTGVRVMMPTGQPDAVYKAAATFKYGGVRGEGSHTAKKHLKEIVQSTHASMGGYVPPKPGFYTFNAGQVAKLQQEAINLTKAALQKRGIEVS
jgi:hypothetical protein